MIDLKPCPFCGSEATIVMLEGLYMPQNVYRAKCNNAECLVNPCTPYTYTEESAVKIWNERAEP